MKNSDEIKNIYDKNQDNGLMYLISTGIIF